MAFSKMFWKTKIADVVAKVHVRIGEPQSTLTTNVHVRIGTPQSSLNTNVHVSIRNA